MKRTARLLLCWAGALGLWTCGAIELWGQDLTDKEIQAAQEAIMVKQFEQQYAPHLRQMYKLELQFMRSVAQPTKAQYEKVAAAGEPALKAATKEFAKAISGQHRGDAAAGKQLDPRKTITDALAKSVETVLPPDQAARYREELDERTATRRRVALVNLVAMVDRALLLTAEQRGKLSAILEKKWDNSWNQTQVYLNGQYFPAMPEAEILPILTETQKTVWRGISKNTVHYGFDFGFMGGGIEVNEEEKWDDVKPPEKPMDSPRSPMEKK